MLIELTRGKHAIIDVTDADLAGRSWHAVPGHYFIGSMPSPIVSALSMKSAARHSSKLVRSAYLRLPERGYSC
jgi:hypothetical protein